MKTTSIHVVLPKSFIDNLNVGVFDVLDALSVRQNGKIVSYQLDIVPDHDYYL